MGDPQGLANEKAEPHEVARQEALEEAGLICRIVDKRPLGTYAYAKRLAEREVLCQVRVFSLPVGHQLDDWPEKAERETKWFDADEAATLVEKGGLADIIIFSSSYVRFVTFNWLRVSEGGRIWL